MTGWINVNDALPKRCENVLVFIEHDAWKGNKKYRKTDIGIGYQTDGYWYVYGFTMPVDGLYWMKLPEPPI